MTMHILPCSVNNHPIDELEMVIRDSDKFRRMIRKAGRAVRKGAGRVLEYIASGYACCPPEACGIGFCAMY